MYEESAWEGKSGSDPSYWRLGVREGCPEKRCLNWVIKDEWEPARWTKWSRMFQDVILQVYRDTREHEKFGNNQSPQAKMCAWGRDNMMKLGG